MNTSFDLALVTGATGWLGKRLVRLLAANDFDHDALRELPINFRIRCLVRPGENAEELRSFGSNVETMEGDLTNPQDCARFVEGAAGALLFHTAGVIHPNRVKEFYEVNVDGIRYVLTTAMAAKVRRIVAVSSNSPLGCNPHSDHLFDENSPYHPYMNYGRSKMMMEVAIREAQASGRIETVVIRPPWFYGPDQPARQTLFFSMIRNGKGPIVGSGNNLRSMAYIDNLCQGLLLAAVTEEARGKTYWIADRRAYSMNEVIDTVERLLEEEFKVPVDHGRMRLPGLASEVAFVADRVLQGVGLYNSKIHVLSEMNKTIACSVALAEKELGYNPKVSLEEGMRRSLQWCFERGDQI